MVYTKTIVHIINKYAQQVITKKLQGGKHE